MKFDSLADYIELNIPGSNVVYGVFTDLKDNVIQLRAGGGMSPRYALGDRSNWMRRPYLHVRVRNLSYTTGYAQTEEVINQLEQLHGVDGIMSISATGDILDQGRDDKNRYRFLISFTIHMIKEN